MTGFIVQIDALLDFAKKCEALGDQMDTLSKSLNDATVGRDAFGHIPMVGSRIYDAYDQHVDQCKETAASSASMIHSIGANVAITAGQYQQIEEENTVK